MVYPTPSILIIIKILLLDPPRIVGRLIIPFPFALHGHGVNYVCSKYSFAPRDVLHKFSRVKLRLYRPRRPGIGDRCPG